jgi:hypothetical protein
MDWSAWLKVGEVILGGAVGGTLAVSPKKQISIRGLNRNHNRDLKNLFKSAASIAAHGAEDENKSCSPIRAGKQEKIRSLGTFFFLKFPFSELIGS